MQEEQVRALLSADGAIVDDAAIAWIIDTISGDLAAGYDSDRAEYREHVHDVIGALVGRGIDPTALRKAIEPK